VAENALAEAEDNLKRVIFPQNDPAMWRTAITPTDHPTAEPMPVTSTRRSATPSRTAPTSWPPARAWSGPTSASSYVRNQLRPQVDLVASYGGTGVGGTQLTREPPIGGPVVDSDPRGLRRRLSEVFGRDFPTWTVGVNLSYSIPNRSAKASAASARLSRSRPGLLPPSRAAGRGRGPDRRPRRRVRLQARGLDPGRAAAGGRAARRRGEEVRGRHVHELPGHPGPARPRRPPRSTSCARSPTTARASSTSSACRRPASPAAAPRPC
jgi:hypothetical protein